MKFYYEFYSKTKERFGQAKRGGKEGATASIRSNHPDHSKGG